MTITLLLVEDDDDHAAVFALALVDTNIVIERARSLRSAEAILQNAEHLDILVCDLRIPVSDEGLEQSPRHGLAVQTTAARTMPGLPAIYLTGVAEGNIDELADATAHGAVSDQLHDGKDLMMVQLFQKSRTLACAQEVLDLAERIRAVDALEITGEVDFVSALTPMEQRAIGLTARRWGGTRVAVERLGGGLSGATTLHAEVSDDSSLRASVFVKISGYDDCADEMRRYREFVEGVLNHHAFPPLADLIHSTLGASACLVYKFADAWVGPLFAHLDEPFAGPKLVEDLRALTEAWNGITQERRLRIGALRAESISDDAYWSALRAIGSTPANFLDVVASFETHEVELQLNAQHGDMHGSNILCSVAAGPTLIDCGDVGMHAAGLDPVTLELSLLTHPASPLLHGAWPDAAAAGSWLDLPAYIASCPYPELVAGLREWALDAAGRRGFLIAAYQYLTHQLKYPTAPSETLVFMLAALIEEFDALG